VSCCPKAWKAGMAPTNEVNEVNTLSSQDALSLQEISNNLQTMLKKVLSHRIQQSRVLNAKKN